MKKHYILYLALVSSFWMLVSCEKQLDIAPISSIGENGFFNNDKEVESVLIGAYAGLQDIVDREYVISEMRSDNATSFLSEGNFGNIDHFQDNASNDQTTEYWAASYRTIGRAVNVLEHLDVIQNATLRDQYEGEAKFIRALLHFNLVRYFGDIPIVESSIAFNDKDKFVRRPTSEVYDLIISDLKDAINKLPGFKSQPSSQKGRATTGAAKGLLAKVYLTLGQPEQARPLLEDVLDDGYKLQSNYADVFSESNEMNDEILFAIRFSTASSDVSENFSFEFTELGGYQGLNVPTVDIWNAFEPGDLRKDAMLGDTMNARKRPFLIKYANNQGSTGGGNDWPVLRFADVILMYAEVLADADDLNGAITQLNRIRERAFGDASHDYDMSSLPDKDSVTQAIRKERRIELAFENQRWFDLLRYGNVVDVMNAHFAKEDNGLYSMSAFRKLYAIPQREIDVSGGALTQNDGY